MVSRPILLAFLGAVPGFLAGQEPPRPVGRHVVVTGRFDGSVKGEVTRTTYSGDLVTEKIDCKIEMEFREDGTVAYNANDYFYEKIYQKKTTTGGYLVGRTRISATGSQGTRRSRLQITVTQYGKVWRANWQPVDFPSDVITESWLTDGRGRTWGHSTPLQTHPMVYCQPKIFWRGQDGKGPGLGLRGSYDGPDVVHPWARVQATWSFNAR